MVSFSQGCVKILPPFTCPQPPASVSILQTTGQGCSCGQVWSHPALCLVTLASVPHCTVGSALWVLKPIPDHSGSRWGLEGTSFLSRSRSSALSPGWLLRFWVHLAPPCLEVFCLVQKSFKASGILVLFQLCPRLSSAPILTKLLAYQCSLSAVAHT